MANKPKIQYAVIDGKNPQNGETVKYPRIVNQRTLTQEDIVDLAIDSYRVKGKRGEIVATVRGVFDQIAHELASGAAVNIAGLVRIYTMLGGQVGEDGEITESNKLNVKTLPLLELKSLNLGDFAFERVEKSDKKSE